LIHLIYNTGIWFYVVAIRVVSLFNEKAKLWLRGRKDVLSKIETWRKQNPGKLVWVHCASLGEFEQGRPVMEAIKRERPHVKIMLTFFSPSGYEVRKNYSGADFICYLLADTPANARRFVEIVQPAAALIIKYEYWANYFFECKRQQIPLYIISGILRPEQRFFGLFSGFWKKVLKCVTHFFVQNVQTQSLLQQHGFSNVTFTGDTRFDRVSEIARTANEIHEIIQFKGNGFCVLGGSTWEEDEKILMMSSRNPDSHLDAKPRKVAKVILVPHELIETKLSTLSTQLPNSIRWSQRAGKDLRTYDVLIVDTIGLLSSIYRYADMALIGGGFGKGIHNILEAAVWGVPVVFGPNYQKFDEAKQLVERGGAFAIRSSEEFNRLLERCMTDESFRTKAGEIAMGFVTESTGATERVMRQLMGFFD